MNLPGDVMQDDETMACWLPSQIIPGLTSLFVQVVMVEETALSFRQNTFIAMRL